MLPCKVIITHGPYCPDGKYAELCARYYFDSNPYDNLVYWQVDAGQQYENTSELFKKIREVNKSLNETMPIEIITFDVAYEPHIITKLLNDFSDLKLSFDIYDHHITSINAWKKDDEYTKSIDNMNNCFVRYTGNLEDCGATLAWKYFFPNKSIPLILEYVRIRDIWLFDTQYAKDIHADIINEYMNTFNVLSAPTSYFSLFNMSKFDPHDTWIKKAMEFGQIITTLKNSQIDSTIKSGNLRVINNKNVFVINSTIYQSDIGNKLIEPSTNPYPTLFDYVIIWRYDEVSKQYNISLRSKKGGVDVSLIAKKFGGGGHQPAAGCTLYNFDDINNLF